MWNGGWYRVAVRAAAMGCFAAVASAPAAWAAEPSTHIMRIVQEYCIANAGRPEAIIAAATRDGWIDVPRERPDSSRTFGKIIDGEQYVLVTSADVNRALPKVYDQSCVVAGKEAYDAVRRELVAWVGSTPPAAKGREVGFAFLQEANGTRTPIALASVGGRPANELEKVRIIGLGDDGGLTSVIFGAMTLDRPPLLDVAR